jgi:poly(3-hydroxybutyrate) depolymerase
VVRVVWPASAAAKAGLKPGDRITKLGEESIDSPSAALAQINAHNPGDKLELSVHRGDEALTLAVELGDLPTDILSADDLAHATASKPTTAEPTDAKAEPAFELAELKVPELSQSARYYKPAGEGRPVGLVMWLADGDEKHNQALAADWRAACDRDRLVLLMPAPGDAKGWSTDDLEFLARVLTAAAERFHVDRARIVVGGEGKAGQLAYVLGFKGRKTIRGIIAVDSPLPRTLKVPQNGPGPRSAVLSVETLNAPLAMLIHQDLKKIADAGFPATPLTRRVPGTGDGRLDAVSQAAVARWIDGLDRF